MQFNEYVALASRDYIPLRDHSSKKRPLCQRHWQIVELVGDGMSNKQIAASLRLSPGSVKTYKHLICQRLGVSGSLGLCVWYHRWMREHAPDYWK